MHELSVANNLVSKAQELLKEYHAKKALAIYVRIGELSSIEKENLEFCYGVLAESLPEFKECHLLIEVTKWAVKCSECGNIYYPDEHLLRCPQCNSQNSILVSGNELDFIRMEAE